MSARRALISTAKAYMRSRILACAAQIGIADALKDAECSVEDLASTCRVDIPSLHRLLRALCCLEIVCEPQRGIFALTEKGQLDLSRFLRQTVKTQNPSNGE